MTRPDHWQCAEHALECGAFGAVCRVLCGTCTQTALSPPSSSPSSPPSSPPSSSPLSLPPKALCNGKPDHPQCVNLDCATFGAVCRATCGTCSTPCAALRTRAPVGDTFVEGLKVSNGAYVHANCVVVGTLEEAKEACIANPA
eukprot:gene30679-64201_t